MAFVLTTKQVKGSGFCAMLTGDLSGTETAVVAVTAKSHYITSISFQTGEDCALTVQDNTGTPVVILGPMTFADTNGNFHIDFDKPIQVASGKRIDVTVATGATSCVIIQGYTE